MEDKRHTRTRKIQKAFLIVLSVLLLFPCGFFTWIFGEAIYGEIQMKDVWKRFTVPVSEEVKQDICAQFDIDEEHLCGEDAVVYGPELFHGGIREYFGIRPYHSDPTRLLTREEVEAKLGKYLDHCTGPVTYEDGLTIYSCSYDLAGDGENPIFVRYHLDDTVYEMMNSTSW